MKIERFKEAADSVKYFTFDSQANARGDCSLVFVSNSGYALTARHCLEPKLNELNATIKQSADGLTIVEIDQNKIKDQTLEITMFENKTFAKELTAENYAEYFKFIELAKQKAQVKIISVQSGHISNYDANKIGNEKLLDISKKHNWGAFTDYALIKIDIKNAPCSPVDNFKKNEKVMIIGYPGAGASSDHLSSEINSPTVSVGQECKVSGNSFDNQINKLSSYQRALYYFSLKERVKEIENVYDKYSSDLIFHSALMSEGASGGGTFNKNGKLIGINIEGIKIVETKNESNVFGQWNPDQVYSPGSYVSLPIDRIKEELLKQKINLSEVFDCK
ncbi:MAG: trypsin-like peptidase domain-containing protein [Bacteriovorax sp.]